VAFFFSKVKREHALIVSRWIIAGNVFFSLSFETRASHLNFMDSLLVVSI
jgi:hypothetical protein